MPGVRVGHARRQNEPVVRYRLAADLHRPGLEVDAGRLTEEDTDVVLSPEDRADRGRDVGRREDGGRHLVEERLERMVVPAVDERDPTRGVPEPAHDAQTSEPRSHDHDPRRRRGIADLR